MPPTPQQLLRAADAGRVDVLLGVSAEVLRGVRDGAGASLLHRAARAGRAECVAALCDAAGLRADGDWAGTSGKTPLYEAANQGHEDCVRALVERGARADLSKPNEWTPLHAAANKGFVGVLEALLGGNQVQVDPVNKEGATPLHLACREGHWEAAKLLLAHGANVNRKNNNARCGLLSACACPDGPNALQTVRVLVEFGRCALNDDDNLVDSSGANPLHEVACAGDQGVLVLGYLRSTHPELCARWTCVQDKGGRTPLHVCAQHNNDVVFRELAMHDPTLVHGLDAAKQTPLIIACARGHDAMVQAALQFGADEFARDGSNRTCAEIARAWGHESVVTLLERRAVRLAGGVLMPTLGFGTYKLGEHTRTATTCALLQHPYRAVDMAEFYGNEAEVGAAVRDVVSSGRVSRDQMFLITKVWNNNVSSGNCEGAVKESLRRIGVDVLDLVLVHWPCTGYEEAFGDLLRLRERGTIRCVGVSNFFPEHLTRLYERFGTYPQVNEIEMSCFLHRPDLESFCLHRGIALVAYRSLGEEGFVHKTHHASLDHPVVSDIAQSLGVSNARVLLRWCVQRGACIVPKSKSPERIADNARVFDFALSPVEHMPRLDGLTQADTAQEWRANVFEKSRVMDVRLS